MTKTSPFSIKLNNVIRSTNNGVVQYAGFLNSSHLDQIVEIKPYDQEGGYQRPLNSRRTKEIAEFYDAQQKPIFPPIVLNASGNWTFVSEHGNSDIGVLICTGPASVIDGQHRLAGLQTFFAHRDGDTMIPFLAIHQLDTDEERDTFVTVNSTAKPINKSHFYYLNRDKDELSWVASQLIEDPSSPFHDIGTLTGVKTRHHTRVTLQQVVRFVRILTNGKELSNLSKEDLLAIALTYFKEIKNTFREEWDNPKQYALSQVMVLNALSMVAGFLLDDNTEHDTVDLYQIALSVQSMKGFNWAKDRFSDHKGQAGMRQLTTEILGHMMKNRTKEVRTESA